ncbi:MAG: class I SAM-dependent methyltransferase [Actinomycetota bacterium]
MGTEHTDGLGQAWDASLDDVRALYDGWASDYDRDVVDWGYDAPAVVADRLAGLVASDAIVLDAGCGTGLTGSALASRGFGDVVGIDLSVEALDVARRRGVYREVAQVDLGGVLPFDDGAFDAVICCGVLSYVSDLERALTEFLRVARSGGPVIITQRTDLWIERDNAATLDRMVASGRCAVDISAPQPYLPRHPEFGTEILIRYVTLTTTAEA